MKEQKEIKFPIPEGYEIDEMKSNNKEIVLKKIEELPKRWEDIDSFKGTYYIDQDGIISEVISHPRNHYENKWKNCVPTKELAEAMLALCQLLMLRDIYNDGWIPDWNSTNSEKYTISIVMNLITTVYTFNNNRILAFKNTELRDKFLKNFRDLIEKAKPLL